MLQNPQLGNALQFSLSIIHKIGHFLIAEINEREKMSNTFNKYITVTITVYQSIMLTRLCLFCQVQEVVFLFANLLLLLVHLLYNKY